MSRCPQSYRSMDSWDPSEGCLERRDALSRCQTATLQGCSRCQTAMLQGRSRCHLSSASWMAVPAGFDKGQHDCAARTMPPAAGCHRWLDVTMAERQQQDKVTTACSQCQRSQLCKGDKPQGEGHYRCEATSTSVATGSGPNLMIKVLLVNADTLPHRCASR